LVNLILRNFLEYNLYAQAEKFASNANVKEEALSASELARYLYYQGRIKSMQLDYSEAFKNLLGASRRAPQESGTGVGFKREVQKWAVLVQLLLGEIPDKQTFFATNLKSALKPYYQLTAAVRIGDLQAFRSVLSTHGESFKKDRTYSLVVR
jgi:26S proteasome regulatory subunit N3